MIAGAMWMWAGCAIGQPCHCLSTRGRDIVGEDANGHPLVCTCQSADTARCSWQRKGECNSGLSETFGLTDGAIATHGVVTGDDDTYEISAADVAALGATCQREFADSGSVP